MKRGFEGILETVLRELEIAQIADQVGEEAAAIVPDEPADALADRGRLRHDQAGSFEKSTIGRTSTAPTDAPGIIAAYLIASSSVGHSKM